MGLGQKIKEVLHGDHQDRTYEDDSPPGAYPTDSERKKYTDNRDHVHGPSAGVGSAGTGNTGGLTNTATTDKSGIEHSTGNGRTPKSAAGPIVPDKSSYAQNEGNGYSSHVPGKTSNGKPFQGHQQTDSGVDFDQLDRKGRSGEYEHGSGRDAPSQNRYWGDVAQDNNRTGTAHGTAAGDGHNVLRKDLPLHQKAGQESGRSNNSSGHGFQGDHAVGGGVYNAVTGAGSHDDPTSAIGRTGESRGFARDGTGGTNTGTRSGGFGTTGVSRSHLPDDPHDTRLSDKDMGRDRTGHGAAGVGTGVGVGAGVIGASELARKHHHDDMRDSGYVNNAQDGGFGVGQTHGDSANYSHTGIRPGESRSSMLDPYASGPANNVSGSGTTTNRGVGSGSGLMSTPGNEFSSNKYSPTSTPPAHGNAHTTGHHAGTLGASQNNTSEYSHPSTDAAGTTVVGNDAHLGKYTGPGHEGATVMHKCQNCGIDNNISHYFKKDAVYRVGS